MKDEYKTKRQLLDDLNEMRQRIAQIELLENSDKQSLQHLTTAEAAISICTNAIASMNMH